jgi:Secretion system C-terminal sorting domain
MKKTLTLLFITSSFIAFSQPIITAPTNMFAVGDKTYSMYGDTNVVEGNSGANQNWDFSSIVPSGSPIITNYISPVGTPYESNFPVANLCAQSTNGGVSSYQYYKTDSSNISYYGYASPSLIYLQSDPEIQNRYPMTYYSNFSDSSEAHYTTNSIDVYRICSSTSMVDGYGTLTIPSGTYQNVLRVKVVQNYIDTFMNSSTLVGTGTATITNYYWISAVTKSQLLFVYYANSLELGQASHSKMVVYYPGILNGISEINTQSKFSVFPNPATNSITLSTSANTSITQLTLVDILGKKYLLNYKKENENFVIDMSEFPNGIYFLQATTNNGILYKKVLIEK